MKKRILIGITGASGSGKTYVARSVVERLGWDKAVVIQEDSYYRDLSHLPYDERAATNFDHPDAFEHDLLAQHLAQLLDGETFSQPVYDYQNHVRLEETKAVEPRDVVILEGILIFSNAQLRELMDFHVFIETALDICFIRRLKRDMAERGRSAESVVRQYEQTVRPMYLQFVEPSRRYADLLICGEEKDSSAVDVLADRINTLLCERRQ
ncbi:MAG: uridine kinase [Planctomycetota bacterium]|jgi:uridine kinase